MGWRSFCECFVLQERGPYEDQTISYLKNVKVCCDGPEDVKSWVNVLWTCKTQMWCVLCDEMKVMKIFQHPSYRGDSAGFFVRIEVSFIIWIYLGYSNCMNPTIGVFCIWIFVFHVGSAFKYLLWSSVLWHLEWLGLVLWSTNHFKWVRGAVQTWILWFGLGSKQIRVLHQRR